MGKKLNWYKIVIAGNREDYLRSIGASEEIVQYISSLDEGVAQFMTNEFRKNPQITLQELKQFQLPQRYVRPNLVNSVELALIEKFPVMMKRWVLKQVRKMWRTMQIMGDNNYDDYVEFLRSTAWAGNVIGQKLSEIMDWVERNESNIDISSYSYDQAVEASDEWHKTVAGMGEGKIYEPIKTENILYGPKWTDKEGKEVEEYDGWTIQRITSENDLLTEGNKCNHCVGSYWNDVEQGYLTIVSLRDPQNNPHVTIEIEDDHVNQIQGNSNQEPGRQYKKMIRHWIQNSDNAPKHFGEDRSIHSVLDEMQGHYSMRDKSEILSNIVHGSDDYGLSVQFDEQDVESTYETVLESLYSANRYGGYNGDWGMGEDLVHIALNIYDDKTKQKNPEKGIHKLISLMDKTEEDAHSQFLDIDLGIPYPEEEDFETPEEYDEAMERYYDAESEDQRDMMPFGFISNLYKDIDNALQKEMGITLSDWWSNQQEKKKEKAVA